METRAGGPVIGVIHATTLSMAPLATAMRAEFPQARIRHLLDDSLLPDLQQAGRITPPLAARIERLIRHLLADDVDAVQLACSGFGPVVDRLRTALSTPVLKPDEAMYAEIAEGRYRHVGIVATVEPALDIAARQLRNLTRDAGLDVRIATACRSDGIRAAQQGDPAAFSRVIVTAAADLVAAGADAIALAQYSMSPVAPDVAEAARVPVYTGPVCAARRLKTLVATSAASSRKGR